MFHKSHFKNYLFFISGILVAIVISSIVLAWREPEVNPPEGQVRGTRIPFECKGLCGKEDIQCPQGYTLVKRFAKCHCDVPGSGAPNTTCGKPPFISPLLGGVWSISNEVNPHNEMTAIGTLLFNGMPVASSQSCQAFEDITHGYYKGWNPVSWSCIICCK